MWLSLLVTDEAGGYTLDVFDAIFKTFFSTLPEVFPFIYLCILLQNGKFML